MEKFERYLYLTIITALIAVIIILLADGCNHKCPPCPEERIVFSENEPSYTPTPTPQPSVQQPAKPPVMPTTKQVMKGTGNQPVDNGDQQIETRVPEPQPYDYGSDYTAEPKQQPVINTYIDTIPLADQGQVVIKDTVQGKILKRAFSYSIKTLKEAALQVKPRARWYVGVDLQGAKSDPIQYLGLSFGLQPKNSKMLVFAGAGINRIGPVNGRPETSGRFGIYTQINRKR